MIDAVLTNCKIKTVFGGLRADSAEMMAKELFIGKLDPMKIKAAIYQTKFWPEYGRDKVYTHGTGHTKTGARTVSSGHTDVAGSSSFSSVGGGTAYFTGDDWLATPQPTGASSGNWNQGGGTMNSSADISGESTTEGEADTESDSVADIPIFIPVPFQELSSVQFMPLNEQLHNMTAALKEQFQRHCFIRIRERETQPLLVPFVEERYTTEKNQLEYCDDLMKQQHALPTHTVDLMLAHQEAELLKDVAGSESEADAASDDAGRQSPLKNNQSRNIFDDLV